uniref:uncharacterized protein LOC101307860 n=1 Tax=Fragaria vesca subsp. vesca TaxID=101020 RepID=UPI0005C94F3E|nr:PREDICTED: uncharacterized protein LOC101307860 [Fragaria vesca subsp. vesca]
MDKGIEFDVLDAHGTEYHRWVSDIEQTFIVKDLTETIFPDPAQEPPHKRTKSQALMFLRKHIDPTLRRQYQSKHDPKDLWDALAKRFGNIHSTLLLELIARWDEIRLLDYKKVDDFNRDMLCLQAQLSSCGVEKSDADMIEKTFSTFPSAAKILMNQYRLEFTNKRITTFSGLMTQLFMEEKNNMINDQHNLRPHHRASGSRGQGSGFSGRTNTWRRDTGAAGDRCSETNKKKRRKRGSGRQNSEICLCRSAYFDRALRAAKDESDHEPHTIRKLRMSTFRSILRFVNSIFLEEVMADLVSEGQTAPESDL